MHKISNLSRAFAGRLYLTTTLSTEIQEVAALPGLNQNIEFRVDEGEANVLEGSNTSVEVVLYKMPGLAGGLSREGPVPSLLSMQETSSMWRPIS